MKNDTFIEIGDMIAVQRLGYWHVGIYVGQSAFDFRDVVHNDKTGGVIVSTMANFSSGAPVVVRQKAKGDYAQRIIIADRARSLVGKQFDLLFFNCEHAATWAQTGKSESPQLQAVCFLGVLALLGLALATSQR